QSGPAGSGINVVGPQVTEAAQKSEQAFAIVRGDVLIESALPDGLGEQFRDVATRIVKGLALLEGAAGKCRIAHHQRAARDVTLHFHGDSQFTAVAEHGAVDGGNASGPGVEIEPLVEGALLDGAVGEFNAGTAPDGPIPSAWPAARLKNDAIESRLP